MNIEIVAINGIALIIADNRSMYLGINKAKDSSPAISEEQ
jgi:hypothetical protein